LAGCGSGFGDVTGKVTYKSRPLASGTVMILASDGRPYDGAIDATGSYAIRKVPTGPARIAVTSLHPMAPVASVAHRESKNGKEAKKSETRLVALEDPKGASAKSMATMKSAVTPANPSTSAIPTRYGSFAASPLTVTIAPGRSTHDIELGD